MRNLCKYDKNDEDTLWVRAYYSEHERKEIDLSLKKIYTMAICFVPRIYNITSSCELLHKVGVKKKMLDYNQYPKERYE